MLEKIAKGQGFIAALDQSGGSTPGALKAYGIGEDAYSNDEEMFGLIHQMRSRIITAPSFGSGKVIGAILFEKTMDGEADGKPVPQLLWERGVVPFLKVDKGLADEADGVQLMKPMPDLEALLDRANAKGIFGTKMRSVIKLANPAGIAAVVAQQFDVAKRSPGQGPDADHRAGSVDQEPGARCRRPHPAGRDPEAARRAAGERAGDAQADDSGRGRPVRAAGRPSQGAARRRAVGRFQPRGSLPPSWPGTRA